MGLEPTLSRLAEGHVVMLFTLLGWAVSIGLFQNAFPDLHLVASAMVGPTALAAPLTLWALWELGGFWRRRAAIASGFRTGYWALSPAVLLIALANSALLLAHRPWSFTPTALCSGGGLQIAPCAHSGHLWVISAVALVTMVGSALLRRSFAFRRPAAKAALRYLLAGLAMGAGGSMIPGGNDGLILFGLPSLSPHAMPSWRPSLRA